MWLYTCTNKYLYEIYNSTLENTLLYMLEQEPFYLPTHFFFFEVGVSTIVQLYLDLTMLFSWASNTAVLPLSPPSVETRDVHHHTWLFLNISGLLLTKSTDMEATDP